jgi:hypothetical protein
MPRFIRHGVIYLNFDQVVRAQVGQNMTGRKTVRLFDTAGMRLVRCPKRHSFGPSRFLPLRNRSQRDDPG